MLDKIAKTSDWEKILTQPLWYLELVPQVKIVQDQAKELLEPERKQLGNELYCFFERLLTANQIALGDELSLWDYDRKPIDTIVIHHTQNPQGITPDRLSAMELIRLYAPRYAHPELKDPNDPETVGKPISSGHVRNGTQVFWPYHWLVRSDGSAERLLTDDEVGWQSGKWEVNCKSVAICLDNDYRTSTPTDIEIQAIAKIIKGYYPQVTKDNIFGHREINLKTDCPSDLFLGKTGWKNQIFSLLT